MLLSEIASSLDCEYFGDNVDIYGMNDLFHAGSGELSFVSDKKYIPSLASLKASAVLISKDLLQYLPNDIAYIVCENVSLTMAYATKLFELKKIEPTDKKTSIGKHTYIDKNCNIEQGVIIRDNCTIMAGAYLGSCVVVGNNTVIYPNVTIYRDTMIANNCIIHSGSVIGADGFGFAHTADGHHIKIYHTGNVVVENDVEIGANCAVDRAVFGSTVIKKGVKLDNFIHIGHNCEIGEYCLLVAQSGVGGSTTLGRNCVVSGQSAFADHLDIAPFSTFTARSGVIKSIKQPNGIWSGYPLMTHQKWMKLQIKIARLLKEEKWTLNK